MEFTNTRYFGGKSGSGTYQKIINQIPEHRIYVELFGGMLGIFRHKRPSLSTFIIEKDESLVNFYAKNLGVDKQHTLTDFMRRIEMGGRNSYVYHGDALSLLNNGVFCDLLDRADVFIYADPPYPLTSRKDSRPQYKYELSDDNHRSMLYSLRGFQYAKIAISTYPNDIYPDLLWDIQDEWRMIEFESQTRNGKATEQLWMNYEEPDRLHDYRYIGEDYRERERIARMQRRWQRKFKDLAVIEQRAMLQNLKTMLDPTNNYGDTS